jgi:hypothetical protein
MNAISILLAAFVGIGLFARKYNTRTFLLVLLVAACMVAYVTFNALRLR